MTGEHVSNPSFSSKVEISAASRLDDIEVTIGFIRILNEIRDVLKHHDLLIRIRLGICQRPLEPFFLLLSRFRITGAGDQGI
jgi:hypothetical protein